MLTSTDVILVLLFSIAMYTAFEIRSRYNLSPARAIYSAECNSVGNRWLVWNKRNSI
jgi:hypothetical protein